MQVFFLELGAMDRRRPKAQKPVKPAQPGRTWAILKFSSLGIEMAVAVAIGLGIGYWLDLQFGTSPIFLLVFLGLGIAAGFLGVFRAAREAEAMMEAEQIEQDAQPRQPRADEPDGRGGESN
jgi:ATP synthase protein I